MTTPSPKANLHVICSGSQKTQNNLFWCRHGLFAKNLYCGVHSLAWRQIFGGDHLNKVDAWFAGKEIFYVHKARVAIRWICSLLNLGQGDEILVPAYNCGSEISSLLNSGVSVVLYQVDAFGEIDLVDIKERLTSKTKAIYITHYFGFPQPLQQLKDICEQNNLYLIEDCALSLFSSDGDVKLGTIGDVSVFNFPKTLPVPDGGLLMINNPDLILDDRFLRKPPVLKVLREMLPLLKRYVLRQASGSSIFPLLWSLLKRTRKEAASDFCNVGHPDMPQHYYYDEHISKTRISKLTKKMLKSFDPTMIVNRRRSNFSKYLDLLTDIKEVKPFYPKLPQGVCPLYFPIIIDNRERVCRELNMLSIDAFAFWAGYHRDLLWSEYPDACFLKDHLLVLPVHQQLNDEHIDFITQKLLEIMEHVRQ